MLKITKEQLQTLKDQEQKKSAILHDLGLLETQSHTLNHYYAELMNAQVETKKELEELYGEINIDLTDGSYKITKNEKDK
tara:strand:- start:275 stop:514 length:240 start_codon:yes stop_codon:yes gene_type:complete